jgi:concanavalin A-like lectin/glucanase superfamily protein
MIEKRSTLMAIFMALLPVCSNLAMARQSGPVGYWNFDQAGGQILHDSSGHENHGRIHGAKWIESGSGHALKFDGLDDYVDCGNDTSLDIRGPMTLSAWVRPTTASAQEPGIAGKYFASYALSLYRGGCWWYISSGSNQAMAPLSGTNRWHQVTGSFDGEWMRLYVNGFEVAKKKSKTTTVNPGKNFLIGHIAPNLEAIDAAGHGRGYFQGLVDEVKVYDRALSLQEVITEYNHQARDKGLAPRDTSWFDRFRLKSYHYPEKEKIVVEVDYRGLLPMAEGARLFAKLLTPDGVQPINTQEIIPNPEQPAAELSFALDGFAPGTYLVHAVMDRNGTQVTEEKSIFLHPRPAAKLPSPGEKLVPALPSPHPPIQYDFSLAPGGGFSVKINDVDYPVESSYSFPHGGNNRLTVEESPKRDGESVWKPDCRRLDDKNYQVSARGMFYSIDRRISLKPNHILIQDTFTNNSDEVVGIILDNRIDTRAQPAAMIHLPKNYTIFIAADDHGLGIVGLDDVYQLQQETRATQGIASMATDKFGLDRNASYTVEWAVYPTASGDYFDFINALRKVERLNRTVDGAFGLIGDGEGLTTAADRRLPADPKAVRAKGMKYVSYFYLIAPEDDPGMSLEGFEFTEYPKESALLKQVIAESHRLNPGLKVMFHIAHGLYATKQSERLFADSRVIDAAGNQVMYGPDSADYYCRYFSRQCFDAGQRWWIFYPTMENSFGKAMLDAIDTMLDEIGASAMYADGFVSGYAGGHTYNTWDGQSVEIDSKTKTVIRKMGNVTLLALPVLKAACRKVAARGGVVITNGQAGPRSLWREHYFTTCETSGGDQFPISRLHLGPTVTAFGDPTRIHNRRDLYHDFLAKLDWGALYFYYGDRNFSVEEEMIIRHCYPFTLDELHSGWIKGNERMITKIPGVYGWHADWRLHQVHRSDARGMLVPNADFSTADGNGVRTELHLEEYESAVVEKIPVEVLTQDPVNVLVDQYDSAAIQLRISGQADLRLNLETGAFPIEAGQRYLVQTDQSAPVGLRAAPALAFPVTVAGASTIRITPAAATLDHGSL